MGAHTLAGCAVLEIGRDDGLDIVCKARGKRKVGGGKREKQKTNKNPRVHYYCPSMQRLNRQCQRSYGRRRYSCDRCDTDQRQAKLREFLTKHWFKEPEDGCHAINMEKVVQRRAEERTAAEAKRVLLKKMTRDP